MNTIYIILLFLGPGLLYKAFSSFMTTSDRRDVPKATIYENLFEVIIWSMVTSFSTLLVIDCFRIMDKLETIQTFDMLFDKMDNIAFLSIFELVSVVILIIISFVYHKRIRALVFEARNKKSSKKSGVKSANADGANVWEDIFFNIERTSKNLVASIYRDDKYVTSGIIVGWNSGYMPKREFEIIRTQEIEKILLDDKSRDREEKWLKVVDYEYYDTENGLLIKFYESDEAIEHWNDLKMD